MTWYFFISVHIYMKMDRDEKTQGLIYLYIVENNRQILFLLANKILQLWLKAILKLSKVSIGVAREQLFSTIFGHCPGFV